MTVADDVNGPIRRYGLSADTSASLSCNTQLPVQVVMSTLTTRLCGTHIPALSAWVPAGSPACRL